VYILVYGCQLCTVQLEMERALLEGEQQIQLEQLETAKEKVASLEAKESRLLAEAAAERAKVYAIFCLLYILKFKWQYSSHVYHILS